MSENQNNQGFTEKLKNAKINRATVITAVLLLVALAVIISVTVATNRSKKNEALPKDPAVTDRDDGAEQESEMDSNTEANTEEETKKPSAPSSSAVVNKLPSFSLPVNGALLKKHDPEKQVYSNTLKDYRVHLGIDISTKENAPVYAAAAGKITKIWEDDLMGYSIAVSHSGNSVTVYQNLAKELPEGIAEGVSVRAGQLIATVGESAMIEVAEEPHLHFEMTVADLMVDPLAYFSESDLSVLKVDSSFE